MFGCIHYRGHRIADHCNELGCPNTLAICPKHGPRFTPLERSRGIHYRCSRETWHMMLARIGAHDAYSS